MLHIEHLIQLFPKRIVDEFFLAEEYGTRYTKLSKYDRIALAIA